MQSELNQDYRCASHGVSLRLHTTPVTNAHLYVKCPVHLPMLTKSELVCNLSLRASIDFLTDSFCGSLAVSYIETDGRSVVVALLG
jgi:hypothetical protein